MANSQIRHDSFRLIVVPVKVGVNVNLSEILRGLKKG